MNISKEVRYAMIRKAVMKVQRTGNIKRKILESNKKLAREVEMLDRGDYKSKISHSETISVTSQYADIYKNTTTEEWN